MADNIEKSINVGNKGGSQASKETLNAEVKIDEDKRWAALNKKWGGLNVKIGNFEQKIQPLEEKISELDEKIHDSNLKIIETLGIFVALFTFVSVEFQIFRSFSSWYAGASLSLILLGALTFFSLLILLLLQKKKPSYFRYLLFFPMFCLVIGIVFLKYSVLSDSNYLLKEEVNKKFYSREELTSIINDNERSKTILNCLRDAEYFKLKCFE